MQKAHFNEDWFNPQADLPYGVQPAEVKTAIKEFYDFYSDLNEFLLQEDHGRIETMLRANNAVSDFVGNAVTDELAKSSGSLVSNQKESGFPDLLPKENEEYAAQNYEVHHGDEGIETKCSKSSGGWQAHNNEAAWFLVFRYERGDPEVHEEEMSPVRFVQVIAAKLDKDDWSHSGREEGSRRTITSSIVASGMHKLRSNPIYEDPDAITGRGEKLIEYRQRHASFDPTFAEKNPEYVSGRFGGAGQ